MHIKSFLKKISEITAPNNNIFQKCDRPASKRHSLQTIKTDAASVSESLLRTKTHNHDGTLRFLDNHNPNIKARMQRNKESSTNCKGEAVKNKFRQRIESRLMELMNQRKDLVVTRVKCKRENFSPIHYSSQKEKIQSKSHHKIPEYAQNMQEIWYHRMKPCRIAAMVIGKRPQTSRLQPSKSEPKIYCKPLLAQRRRRISTTNLSQSAAAQAPLKTVEDRKMELIAVGKLDGWNRSKNNEEDEDVYLR